VNGRRNELQPRIVLGLVLSALLLVVAGVAYLSILRASQPELPEQPPASERTDEVPPAEVKRLSYTLALLLVAVLLILAFVVGAYLVIRVGRLLTRDSVGGQPTHYVDAWSQYRVTDDQIDAATEEGADRDTPGRNPDTDARDADADGENPP